jgi:hypothetical protein
MQSPDILTISLSAFVAVFLILSALAVLMQLITKLFPTKRTDEDWAIYSVIASVHSAYYPGKQITKIEEVK